ncbi:MAG: cyclic nucleotide-binding domain-containing protein [Pseudomonadota bacterium]
MSRSFEISELGISTDSDIPVLLKKCPDIRTLVFSDGEYIIKERDTDKNTFFVLRGAYVVEHSQKENDDRPPGILATVMSDLNSPSVVGEMAYLGGGPRTASVRSAGASFVLVLKPEHMDVVLNEFPFFSMILCRQFTARLKEANEFLKLIHERTAMEVKRINKDPGESIIEKGNMANTLYQLVIGTVQWEEKEEIIGTDQLAHGFIEPKSFLRGEPYSCTVKAKTPVILVEISNKSKLALIRRYPDLILKLFEE